MTVRGKRHAHTRSRAAYSAAVRFARVCALLAMVGCDGVFGLDRLTPPTPPPVDATPPTFAPFGPPMPLAGIVTPGEDDDPALSEDGLEIYFLRDGDLYSARRDAVEAPWSGHALVAELSSSETEMRPSLSADGLRIDIARGGMGVYDIFVATRPSRRDGWNTPALLAIDLNQSTKDAAPGWSSPDGLTLFVESSAGANHDIFIATRTSPGEPFVSAPFDAIEFGGTDGAPWATAAGSTLVFASNRSGEWSIWEAVAFADTWMLHRHTELDVAGVRGTPWLSPDGRMIVFTGTRAGGTDDDLYFATR